MYIKSSKIVHDIAPSREDLQAGVTVSQEAGGEASEGDVSALATRLTVGGTEARYNLTIDTADLDSLTAAQITAFCEGVALLNSDPRVGFTRTATGGALGGLTGLGLGVFLQQTQRMGAQTGNPWIGSLALACGVIGVGLGGLAGARIADITVGKSKDGITATGRIN